MSKCSCENWTLMDLSSALQDMHKDNKRIVVPMFQRGKRWKKTQEHKFIDSLIKGYPVGTMLFYETYEDNKRTYILVDGLQRGNSIKKYITNPTEFFYDDSISDVFCHKVTQLLNVQEEDSYKTIKTILTTFIKEQKTFKNLQYYTVAKDITDAFGVGYEPIGKLIELITELFQERQNLYDDIASTVIPVVIYTGEISNLPEIFDRINSQGTPLDQYEVYAASWPINDRYKIENQNVVDAVIKKYDSFIEDEFQIHGYDKEQMRTSKKLNSFEYLFGLGKYLVSKYDELAFNKGLADDTVNPLSFELVNACLNDSDKIKSLYQNIAQIDINEFEKALYEAVDFVIGVISVITKFKGNKHSANKIFHSKYQIMSMISSSFKEMYENNDFTKKSDKWDEKKSVLSKNLLHYYVYDIITNYWSEGGTSKIHSASKLNKYMTDIPSRAWMIALDGFFGRTMLRCEKKNIANPKSEDYVILNCIYLNCFTAMDQLSMDKFDVEHIAPKEQMRKLIDACSGEGLAVSSIANLCYLPDYVNRSKKDKNFYQDKKYLQHINLDEVEKKYSFTEFEDLEWMDIEYERPEDFEVLKEYYTEYCEKRFDKLKRKFCESMSIEYVDSESDAKEDDELNDKSQVSNEQRTKVDKHIEKISQKLDVELVKVGRSTYISQDGKKGFIVSKSKMYTQGQREKYWFAYRSKIPKGLEQCEELIYVYCCKDENTIFAFPKNALEEKIDNLNYSMDDDVITHWHMVFFKDNNGEVSWLLSKPDIREEDIKQYLI